MDNPLVPHPLHCVKTPRLVRPQLTHSLGRYCAAAEVPSIVGFPTLKSDSKRIGGRDDAADLGIVVHGCDTVGATLRHNGELCTVKLENQERCMATVDSGLGPCLWLWTPLL